MARVRDFRPEVLQKYRHPRLEVAWRPGSGFEGRVWQFTIFLPRRFLGRGVQQTICTTRDEDLLENLLEQDFGGCTSLPSFARGIGRRGESFETNLHRLITVLTSFSLAKILEIFQGSPEGARGMQRRRADPYPPSGIVRCIRNPLLGPSTVLVVLFHEFSVLLCNMVRAPRGPNVSAG